MAISKNIILPDNLVSIIVPCYNQAQYLDEALESVLNQTYEIWECIIINDGSPDKTADIAAEWVRKDSRFLYFYKENGGLSSARNLGLDVAKGDYIQFLDCDDLLENKKIEVQINHLLNNPDVGISVSGYRYFEVDINRQRILGRNNFLHEVVFSRYDADIKEVFNLCNPMVISAPLFRKKIIDVVGNFDESLSALEDWEFNFRCALHNFLFEHIGYCDSTKTLIRLHNKSMMSNQKKIAKQVQFFKEHISGNLMYLNYFGKEIEGVKKKKCMKSIVKQFIPPILLKLYYYAK